jgi:hypothetical protein
MTSINYFKFNLHEHASHLIALVAGERCCSIVCPEDVLLQPVGMAVRLAAVGTDVLSCRRRTVLREIIDDRGLSCENETCLDLMFKFNRPKRKGNLNSEYSTHNYKENFRFCIKVHLVNPVSAGQVDLQVVLGPLDSFAAD